MQQFVYMCICTDTYKAFIQHVCTKYICEQADEVTKERCYSWTS